MIQEFERLPDAGKVRFDELPTVSLQCILRHAPREAADLIDKLLVLSPGRRSTAAETLHHPWFREPVLGPREMQAWYGIGPSRREVGDVRMVEEVDGNTLLDILQPWLEEARDRYARL